VPEHHALDPTHPRRRARHRPRHPLLPRVEDHDSVAVLDEVHVHRPGQAAADQEDALGNPLGLRGGELEQPRATGQLGGGGRPHVRLLPVRAASRNLAAALGAPLFYRARPLTELADKTLFISGGSRGIGLAIALRAARDGANVALIAKTAEPHPKLEGTVYTAAEAIEEAGGQALPIVGDIREEEQVASAVEQAVERFGGIDVCVNNASAINLAGTEALPMKRYDLMQDVNARGTFLVSKACVPHLKSAQNAHVLTLSPPISLEPRWLKAYAGYAIAKYGMSLCTLGMAEEFRAEGIAFNSLWPRTPIATAAVQNLLGGDEAMARSRKPELVADAAHAILTRPSRECTGNLFLAEDLLVEEGVTDFAPYSYGGGELIPDLFVDAVNP